MSLRVLFISNLSTQRCGVRIYGNLWVEHLRAAGVEITEWDGTYSSVVANGYVPENVADYDLVHLNWDPQAINHYLPVHFKDARRLSVFLHDVPPNSTCPVAHAAELLLAHEPGDRITVIHHAVPTFRPKLGRLGLTSTIIGTTGIRDDPGHAMVHELCRKRGWMHNGPGGPWLTTEEEIIRLSLSTVNVCWYQTSGRGKSMAAMFCIAAGRPLVLSGSTMFSALDGYEATHYRGRQTHKGAEVQPEYTKHLEALVQMALDDIKLGRPLIPDGPTWWNCAQEIKGHWEALCGSS